MKDWHLQLLMRGGFLAAILIYALTQGAAS